MTLSVYGASGIIGSYFLKLYQEIAVPRNNWSPQSSEILYLISTTSNTYSDPLIHTDTNIDCLMKRLMACKDAGIKTFNFVSSWFVYGECLGVMRESDYCKPKGLYSITKHCAEQIVIDYCSKYQINWRILRLGNVYGGPDRSNGQRNVLHYLIQRLKEHLPIEGVSGMSRDYIHILDTCRAIHHLCHSSPENAIYNIGSGNSTPLSRCLDHCKQVLHSSSAISYRPPRNDEQSLVVALDCIKLFDTGFSPLLSLEEGLTDLCVNQRFSTPVHSLTGMK